MSICLSTRLGNLDYSAGWVGAFYMRSQRRILDLRCVWFCQQRGRENKNWTCSTQWDNSEATWMKLGREGAANQALSIAVEVRNGVPSSKSRRRRHGRSRKTWMRHSTADTGKCPRTAFVDAIDRGHTTGAILHAEHAALTYWITAACQNRGFQHELNI